MRSTLGDHRVIHIAEIKIRDLFSVFGNQLWALKVAVSDWILLQRSHSLAGL